MDATYNSFRLSSKRIDVARSRRLALGEVVHTGFLEIQDTLSNDAVLGRLSPVDPAQLL